MNLRTFNTKETLLFKMPELIVDLAIHLGVFEWMLTVFRFTDPQDLILKRPRSLYFLVVGYIISKIVVSSKLYERNYSFKVQIWRVFLQCLLTLGVMAASINILFHSFAGKFFLFDGMLAVALIGVWHLLFRALILYARRHGRNKVHVVIVGDNENARNM